MSKEENTSEAANAAKLCPTIILDDAPAEADFLGSDGPHARIANTIAIALREGDLAGKIVGVEGGWGSGKTTVVTLVQRKLQHLNRLRFLRFDAWAHEGDPLRRTFLESLIRDLIEAKWIDRDTWSKRLAELAHRRKETTTKKVPVVTPLGKAVAVASLLVPIGFALFNSALPHLTVRFGLPLDQGFWLSVLLIGAPFWIILAAWLVQFFRKEPNDLALALLKGELTETTEQTTDTPDPTSIEFESLFNSVLREALPDAQRSLVIVLDNLDRINESDALKIWSTLQLFLHRPVAHPWHSRTTVLVTYDHDALMRLWNKGNSSQIVGQSFIDKSLQLRFEVPPLLLSSWKTYLMKLIEEALPEHPDEDRQLIYKVFTLRSDQQTPPTPRELRLFVNQIGVVHRQWQDTFPLGHVAYYASLRRSGENIPNGLLTGALPLKPISALFPIDSDIRGSLAGLFYNVTAELGTQIILAEPIYRALIERDARELSRLAELNQDGFWVVLESVASSRLDDLSASHLANVSLCLDDSNLLSDNARSEANSVRHRLAFAARRIASWTALDQTVLDGCVAIRRVTGDNDITPDLLRGVSVSLGTLEPSPSIVNELAPRLARLISQLRALGDLSAVHYDGFTIPADAHTWIEDSRSVLSLDESLRGLIHPTATFQAVADELGTMVSQGKFLPDNLYTLRLAPYTFEARPWSTLSSAIENRLQVGKVSDSTEVDFLLHALALLRIDRSGDAESALTTLATNGLLMHWLHLARSQGNVACQAWCIADYLFYKSDLQSLPSAVGNSGPGIQALNILLNNDDASLAGHILEVLGISGLTTRLFEIVDKKGYDPLIVRCLRMKADALDRDLYTPGAVLDHWSALIDELSEDSHPDRLNKLIDDLCAKSNLIDTLQASAFNHRDARLYLIVARSARSASFVEWCQKGLDSIDEGAWKSEISKFGYALQLALAMNLKLRTSFLDALINVAKDAAGANARPSADTWVNWKIIITALDSTSSAVLPRDLLKKAAPQDFDFKDTFFEMFGDQLADPGELKKEATTVAELLRQMVHHRRTAGLRWFRNVIVKSPKLLDSGFDSALIGDFRARLQNELNNPSADDDAHNTIIEIAGALGMAPQESPHDDKADIAKASE